MGILKLRTVFKPTEKTEESRIGSAFQEDECEKVLLIVGMSDEAPLHLQEPFACLVSFELGFQKASLLVLQL